MRQQSNMPERIWAIKWKYKEQLTAWDSPSSGSEESCYIRESTIEQRAKIAAEKIMWTQYNQSIPLTSKQLEEIILNTLKGQ